MAGPWTGPTGPLAWFGSILSSAFQRATTAQVWANLQEAAAQTGQLVEGLTIFDVNQMRAIAGGVVSATEALNRANPDFAITSEYIATPPVTATGGGTGLPEEYMVRFNYTGTLVNGEEVSGTSTIYLTEGLPETVGELQVLVEQEAQGSVEAGTGSPPVAVLTDIGALELSIV
jgi:hypothetical protein